MPVRSTVWGLLTVLAASQLVPTAAYAQYGRSPGAFNRGNRYKDFVPGPAMRGPNAVNPEHEKIKRAAQEAYRKHDFKRAIELVEPILKQKPKDAVGLHIRGSAKIELGLREGNVETVRQGIADARESVTEGAKNGGGAAYYIPYLHGMIALAKLEGRKEHATVAIDIAQQVLELDDLKFTEKANLRFQRARAYTFLGEFEKAAGEYEKAIEIDDSHVNAYVALANAYAKAEKHDKALEAFNTACEAFENSALLFNNRGTYLRTQGKMDEAVADFGRAVEIDSQFVVGYINRGYTLMQLGRPAEAEKDFDKVAELAPERRNINEFRSQARIAQGKLQAGIEDIQKVTAAFPKYAKGHANLGFAQYFAGDFEAAKKAFDTAVDLDPSMKHLETWRLLCRIELDEMQDLDKQFPDTFAKPADKRDWVDNLVLYLGNELTAEELLAVIDTKDEKRADQQKCEAHFVVSRKLAKLGETDKAQEELAKVLGCKATHLSAYRAAQFLTGKFDVAEKPTDAVIN